MESQPQNPDFRNNPENFSPMCHWQVDFFYQSPLILTALLHIDLINVAYLTACAFIRSS